MEEILASIRRIISEDEVPAEDGAPEAVHEDEPVAEEPAAHVEEPEAPGVEVIEEPVVAEVHAPELEPEEEDDVLELTDKVETLGDLDVYTPASAPQVGADSPIKTSEHETDFPQLQPLSAREGLVSDPAANAAAAAFGHLSASMMMPKDGRSLEDVVRELLRPMLKQWLDEHLPTIVQESVRSEVERISRGGRVG